MSNHCVVVVKLHSGGEILGCLVGESNTIVRLQHPHYVRYGVNAALNLIPYCLISDETYFEFDKAKLEFLVLANPVVANSFISMIEKDYTQRFDHLFNQPESPPVTESVLVEGNDTKH